MKEEEIRPKKVFEEYLRLATEDSEIYLGNSAIMFSLSMSLQMRNTPSVKCC